jgi:hypothetical protein
MDDLTNAKKLACLASTTIGASSGWMTVITARLNDSKPFDVAAANTIARLAKIVANDAVSVVATCTQLEDILASWEARK